MAYGHGYAGGEDGGIYREGRYSYRGSKQTGSLMWLFGRRSKVSDRDAEIERLKHSIADERTTLYNNLVHLDTMTNAPSFDEMVKRSLAKLNNKEK